MQFKGHSTIQALLDFNSKFNAMTQVYTAVLELRICPTNVSAHKIDRLMLLTHGMILAIF